MTALVLDAGALIAIDRNDRAMAARLYAALENGFDLRTHPMVVAQVWRDPHGRQANLARLLHAVDVVPLDDRLGRAAGLLCADTDTNDPIDAAIVLIAEPGDRVLTSDRDDISSLLDATGTEARVVAI
ncbi:MAG TPA: hypothetical protein ENH15_00915 [Actinobacteria bacterium]|nr:hypothetical protein [Actinomycetota bacterium]